MEDSAYNSLNNLSPLLRKLMTESNKTNDDHTGSYPTPYLKRCMYYNKKCEDEPITFTLTDPLPHVESILSTLYNYFFNAEKFRQSTMCRIRDNLRMSYILFYKEVAQYIPEDSTVSENLIKLAKVGAQYGFPMYASSQFDFHPATTEDTHRLVVTIKGLDDDYKCIPTDNSYPEIQELIDTKNDYLAIRQFLLDTYPEIKSGL